jgi:hypothetical protein
VSEPSRPPGEKSDRSPGTNGGGHRRHPVRIGARWADERELGHAIHGIVVGSAVMVAAGLHGTLLQVVISVAGTLLVYWATERYAELLAAGARGRMPDGPSVRAALRRGWPMLESSYTPVIVLLAASALGAELPAAVLAALCVSTVLLAGLGYGAARRSDATVVTALAWASASALLGAAIIVLKLLLH